MLNIQKFFRTFRDRREAIAELATMGITVREYPDDGIMLLDYDQIAAAKTHPITIECRSLILDLHTYALVSRKFNRFFNYGEALDYYQDFSFKDSVVFSKEDGSLTGVYFNPNTSRWEISTRGMAKAEGPHPFGSTFKDKILAAFGFESDEAFQITFDHLANSSMTYVFEYCSPENRIVRRYTFDEMVLLAITNNEDSAPADMPLEYCDKFVKDCQLNSLAVRSPVVYDKSTTLAEMVEVANHLTDLHEGFVVYDPSSGKRVKVKSATYLVAHKLRGNDTVPTRKNILSLLLEGDADEMLAYFPEYKPYVDPVREELAQFEQELVTTYQNVMGIESQKDFALAVNGFKVSGILFSTRKLKSTDPVSVFRSMQVPAKMRLFGI